MKSPIPYRPSAYFFRLELRAARSRKVAAALVISLVDELEKLAAWLLARHLESPRFVLEEPPFYYGAVLAHLRERDEIIEIGLRLVLELEERKAWAREHGLIPPRFNLTHSERLAKADLDLLAAPCALIDRAKKRDQSPA